MLKITVTPDQLQQVFNNELDGDSYAFITTNTAGEVTQCAAASNTGEYLWIVLTQPMTQQAVKDAGVVTLVPVQSIN